MSSAWAYQPARSRPTAPSPAVRALGLLGLLGGGLLLAVFVIDIPPAANTVRLLLFLLGAIAVGLAVVLVSGASSRTLALAGTIPLVAANAAAIAWLLLAQGRERPFAGDFGLLGFYVGLATWLADAWFGLVVLRLGLAWRWAGAVLAVGSLMAIAGMDRLGLTSAAEPTVFGSIGVTGIALSGLAWMLLGLDLALHPGRPASTPAAVAEGPSAVARRPRSGAPTR